MIQYLKSTELDDHFQLTDSIIPVDVTERAKHFWWLEIDAPRGIDDHKQIDSIIINFLGIISQFQSNLNLECNNKYNNLGHFIRVHVCNLFWFYDNAQQ